MKRCRFIGILLFGIILLLSCQQTSRMNNQTFSVATSVFPVYDIVRSIGGDRLDVFYTVPIGANPHTYEPVPSDIQKLQDADLFLGIHPDFDGWIRDFLPESVTQSFFLNADHEEEEGERDPAHEAEDHSHHKNPHIWLSIRNTIDMTGRIEEMLSSLDAENQAYYLRNKNDYLDQLNRLDVKIKGFFDTVEKRRFIQWHPAWDYFAEEYDLEIVGTIESGHGDEPSVRKFKMLSEKAIQKNVKVIVIGLNMQDSAAEAMANEIDGTCLLLDTIGDPSVEAKSSYLKLMHTNAKMLADALRKLD